MNIQNIIDAYVGGQEIFRRKSVGILIAEINMLRTSNQLLQESIWNVGEWIECPKCHHQSPPEYICLSCGYDHSAHKERPKVIRDVEGYDDD